MEAGNGHDRTASFVLVTVQPIHALTTVANWKNKTNNNDNKDNNNKTNNIKNSNNTINDRNNNKTTTALATRRAAIR